MVLQVVDSDGVIIDTGVIVKQGEVLKGITNIDGEIDLPAGIYTLYAFERSKDIVLEMAHQIEQFDQGVSYDPVEIVDKRTHKRLYALAALLLLIIIWRKWK